MSKIPPWATTQSLKGLLDTKCGDGNGKVSKTEFKAFLEKHDDNPDLNAILNGEANIWAYDKDHFKNGY